MKTLIVVCEEGLEAYGNYLKQLITLKDDKEDSIVGTKDGTVQALVWKEKDYNSSAKTISSTQHIVFIGNSRMMKNLREPMPEIFSQFNMKCKALGTQAFLFVDDFSPITFDYKAFLDYAKKSSLRLKKWDLIFQSVIFC